ncbi:NB-ARC domains-containing protein [Tanacetum coccineum]
MATTSFPHRWKYDVFVSFRGEDIRKNFMDHLFNDFKQKGINAFRDDNKLPKGEEISPHLYKAIEESRILIVIFSKNYASSSWCLQELGAMLKRLRNKVSNRPEVDNWKEALSMAANLSGWTPGMTMGMSTSSSIASPKTYSKNYVTGPCTLVKTCCFCKESKRSNKRQGASDWSPCSYMIGKIMKTEDVKISGVGEGIMVIKKMMSSKPILLVLDDVDDHEQLEALAGSPTWFCPGSLIIFTGKDKQLLRSHRVDGIHDMKFLDEDKSLELFYSFAFDGKNPSTGFEEAAEKVVKYVQGHPLALKVLGRFLYGKTVGQWVSELDQLKVHLSEKIQSVLRLSYDGLNLHQQNILLDIACVFIGENSDFVASVLDGCNFFADTNMRVLVDKSLITISSNMSLQMHDLIQAMAKAIVREESIIPDKKRRLLISSNVYDISGQNKVTITEAVEVLVLSLQKFSQKVHIDANDFAHMKKLRILKIYQEEELIEHRLELEGHSVIFSGNLYYLSNELSLFYWYGCPFKLLPSDFYPENIVVIDLSYSSIKQLWTTPKCLRRLKIMKLRYCCNLTTIPDFSEITNLEELSLEGCMNLVSVHPSIGMLKRLVVLNLRDCKRLQNFPCRVEMDDLQVLNLSGCLNVNQLREAFWSRWWSSIPGFRWNQQHPQRSVSLEGLHMLKKLNLSYCNLLVVPESIGGLSFLKKLHLEGNNFTSLPGSLSQLSNLERLYVEGCKKLELLPKLPPSVWNISAPHCTSLREVLGSSKDYMKNDFRNCPKLFKNVSIDSDGPISKTKCLDSSITSQGFIHQLSAFLGYLGIREFFSQYNEYSSLDIVCHGNSMPEWFTNRSRENHVKVELPSDWCFHKFRGYGICVVFKCKKPFNTFKEGYSIKNFDGATLIKVDYIPHVIEEFLKKEVMRIQESYMIWLHYERVTQESWKEAKNFVTFCFKENNEDVEVKECGVRLICDGDLQQGLTYLSMFQDLPQHGGAMSLDSLYGHSNWSCLSIENKTKYWSRVKGKWSRKPRVVTITYGASHGLGGVLIAGYGSCRAVGWAW